MIKIGCYNILFFQMLYILSLYAKSHSKHVLLTVLLVYSVRGVNVVWSETVHGGSRRRLPVPRGRRGGWEGGGGRTHLLRHEVQVEVAPSTERSVQYEYACIIHHYMR